MVRVTTVTAAATNRTVTAVAAVSSVYFKQLNVFFSGVDLFRILCSFLIFLHKIIEICVAP